MKTKKESNIIKDDLALLDKEEIKWNQETLDAFAEAEWLAQGNGKSYKSFEELWKDVFGHE